MKKFISALTSLVLTATAMGGSLAMSTSAAASTETEVTFCTGTDHSTSLTAKAGDKINVDVYITKSAGFVSANMKMVLKKDGKVAFGKDGRASVSDADWAAENEPASALADIKAKMTEAGVTPALKDDHWKYGSYGFKFGMAEGAGESGYISGTIQLASGYFCGAAEAGNPGQFSFYNPDEALLTYSNNGAATYTGAYEDGTGYADLYAAFEDSGLTARNWAKNGTPITSWDGTEGEMIYRYPLNTLTLTVPADVEPGEYTLDLLTEDYYLPTAISWCHSNFTHASGTENKMSVKPLTITVEGEGGSTTSSSTTSSSTTSSTTSSSTTSSTTISSGTTGGSKPATPTGTIQFDLLPMEGENDVDYAVSFDGTNNLIEAKPGANIVMALYASNDPGCAGQLVYMDFSQVEFVEADVNSSSAYTGVSPTANAQYANKNDSLGQKYVSIVWVSTTTLKAKAGEPIAVFEINVPNEKGTYTIGEKSSVKVEVENGETATRKTTVTAEEAGAPDIPYVFYGLTINAGGTSTTSSSTTSSSTTSSTTSSSTTSSTTSSSTTSGTTGSKPATPTGTIQFDLLPMEGENDVEYTVSFDGTNNVIDAKPGANIVMALYASNDPGCAGQLVYMDFSQVEFVEADVNSSSAYTGVSPTANAQYANKNDSLGQKYVSIVWVSTTTLKAKEGEPIAVFEINVPNEKGTYTIGEKASVKVEVENGETATRKTTVTAEEAGAPDIPYVFYGLTINAGSESTTSSSTTSSTTESTTTSSTTTSSTTSSSSVVGDKVWGDVNKDGDVTISDMILLNKALTKNATLDDQAQKNADTDNDGKLSTDDVLLIKGYLAKFIEKGTTDVAALKALLK